MNGWRGRQIVRQTELQGEINNVSGGGGEEKQKREENYNKKRRGGGKRGLRVWESEMDKQKEKQGEMDEQIWGVGDWRDKSVEKKGVEEEQLQRLHALICC